MSVPGIGRANSLTNSQCPSPMNPSTSSATISSMRGVSSRTSCGREDSVEQLAVSGVHGRVGAAAACRARPSPSRPARRGTRRRPRRPSPCARVRAVGERRRVGQRATRLGHPADHVEVEVRLVPHRARGQPLAVVGERIVLHAGVRQPSVLLFRHRLRILLRTSAAPQADDIDHQLLLQAKPTTGAGRRAPRAGRSRRRSARASSAATASSRWCGFVAPTIGAVTPGFEQHPRQRHLGTGNARSSAISATRSTTTRSESTVSYSALAELVGCSRARGLLVPVAGQPAAGERAPRDHADALVGAQRQHLPLLLAVEQVVVVLHADEPGPAVRVGGVQRLGELPRVHRGRADVARLARLARRRAAPRGSPRSACGGPSGGSGRGRCSRCRAGAGCGRSRS